MKTFWISFADDTGNLGCCIVDSSSIKDAITKTRRLGINPGGEAMAVEVPDDPESIREMDSFGKDRLIPKSELVSKGYAFMSDLPEEKQKEIEGSDIVSFVCEGHNK